MYQHFYTRFLKANPKVQHFACHSHHYWPDVTREAMLAYWDDSARLVDDKWSLLFGQKMPQVQQKIAKILNLASPNQIVFAPNTHEFVMRLLSCLEEGAPRRVVTTDSEFHSFTRQMSRLEEEGNWEVIRVPTEPFTSFTARFCQAVSEKPTDFIFFSHVFFNSGVGIADLPAFVHQLEPMTEAIIVVDGYHGFMATETDLSSVAKRIFYLAGSYKYAQGGEGCCFLVVPEGSALRPRYTGWFAEFGELSKPLQGQIGYASNGQRFAGSTMDFSALYRVLAVFELFEREGLGVAKIQAYIQSLQREFLLKIDALQHPLLNREHLLSAEGGIQGQFLTFRFDAKRVASLAQSLKEHGVYTDYRGDRLRFGFALYQDAAAFDFSFLKS